MEHKNIKVFIWEHSPEFAGELSKRIYEEGFALSSRDEADIIIVGPGIKTKALEEEYRNMSGKSYVLVIPEESDAAFKNASTIFEIVSRNTLDGLGAAVENAAAKIPISSFRNIDSDVKTIARIFGFTDTSTAIIMNRVHYLLDNLPIGVISLSRSKGILGINSLARQMLNMIDKDIIGMSSENFCQQFALCPDYDADTSRDSEERPLIFLHHFAKDVVVEVYMAQVNGTDESILLLDDISEQRREQEWMKGLMGAIGDGILILDLNRKIVWSNKVISDWFGDRISMMPMHCFNIWANADRPCPNCPLEKVFAHGDICRFTERLVGEDGNERYFDVIAAPIRSSDGKVYRVVQLARDVTQREHLIRELMSIRKSFEGTNRQLREQYSTLRTVIEISDTLQQETTLESILRIILTAATAKEGLGFNRAFLLLVNKEMNMLEGKIAIGPSNPGEAGKIWAELSNSPRTLSETLRAYQKAIRNKDTEVNRIVRSIKISLDSDSFLKQILNSGESLFVSPENTEIWKQSEELRKKLGSPIFAVVSLWAMTKPVGVILADNMITQKPISNDDIRLLKTISNHASLAIERSFLTDELQRSYTKLEEAYSTLRENQQKLVEAEKLSTIGAMAAQIAHEIRNPLVSIGGFARSLIADISPDNPQYESLRIIIEEGERLDQFVKDVLGFAKLSESKKEQGNITEIINSVLLLFEPEFDERRIAIDVKSEDDIPTFNFDANQMRQVLINLIRNSLNVLDVKGKITIRLKREENRCWIEIADNGPGIPKEYGADIFKPFFTTRTSGTGLGLSISAGIIEAHGGTIWYKNNPAGGVTFYIRLPLE